MKKTRGYLFVKNAFWMTASGLVLRAAGMVLRVFLARVLGGEGMGLYQLIFSYHGLFVTFATSGLAVAAPRMVAEAHALFGPERAERTMRSLVWFAWLLGGAAFCLQFFTARPVARFLLGDERAALSLQILAFSLPFMAAGNAYRGYFLARQRVRPNILSQLVEQAVRIGVVAVMLYTVGGSLELRCAWAVVGNLVSEVISCAIMACFYRAACSPPTAASAQEHLFSKILQIVWPIESGRLLSTGIRTAESSLVPATLARVLEGGRTAAMDFYGQLHGMAMPMLMFPTSLLNSIGTLLMPELTKRYTRGEHKQLRHEIWLAWLVSLAVALPAAVGLYLFGPWLTELLYHSREAGQYVRIMAPFVVFMYTESVADTALKSIGEQVALLRYNVTEAALRIVLILLLIPHTGSWGMLFTVIVSNIYTCLMKYARLFHKMKREGF